MISEHAIGHIKEIREDGTAVIYTALPNLDHALHRRYDEVEIIFADGRRITPTQRRKIYGLLGDIAEFVDGFRNADTVEDAKNMLKWDFALTRMEAQERRLFSLANVDETTATAFISYLIDFIVKHDIPVSVPLLEQCEDISKYIYACLMARKCCVCGKGDAHIHHCEGSRIGAGNDRTKVHHLGREVLPLCGQHHNECHQDEASFIERYHLAKVKLDEALCKRLKLKK